MSLGLESSEKLPPVPPPVKLAPSGCVREIEKTVSLMALRALTPMGRDLSLKAQLSDVHRHFPSIGSQNGVEQLAGTRQEIRRGKIPKGQEKLTAHTRLLASRNILLRVRVGGGWNDLGAPILESDHQQRAIAFAMVTYTCVEGEFGEGTVVQQAGLAPGNSVTDLGINLRSRAPKRFEVIEVSATGGVLRPRQELLAGDDPN